MARLERERAKNPMIPIAERATSRNTAISLPRSDLMKQHLLKNVAAILPFSCKNTPLLGEMSRRKELKRR
jgi:hypothetical protein